MTENNGMVILPSLKHTGCLDYNNSQKKRFSEWGVVAKTFDTLLLKEGIQVPARPTGPQITSQFDEGLQLHLREVCDWHPSMRTRRRNRNGDVAKKVSTIATEIRNIKKRKKLMKKQLANLQLFEYREERYWLKRFVRQVKFVLFV